jgi:uncharacterized ferritin-like protein (DUF455 family)
MELIGRNGTSSLDSCSLAIKLPCSRLERDPPVIQAPSNIKPRTLKKKEFKSVVIHNGAVHINPLALNLHLAVRYQGTETEKENANFEAQAASKPPCPKINPITMILFL